jgi:hypothetical protein
VSGVGSSLLLGRMGQDPKSRTHSFQAGPPLGPWLGAEDVGELGPNLCPAFAWGHQGPGTWKLRALRDLPWDLEPIVPFSFLPVPLQVWTNLHSNLAPKPPDPRIACYGPQ